MLFEAVIGCGCSVPVAYWLTVYWSASPVIGDRVGSGSREACVAEVGVRSSLLNCVEERRGRCRLQ